MKKRLVILITGGAILISCFYSFITLGRSGIFGCNFDRADRRVKNAREDKQNSIKEMFREAGVSYPPERVFMRLFKLEDDLELWARDEKSEKFKKIKAYQICSPSGELGPKRKQGDKQVPEGVYNVNRFNPCSRFHLSLGLDYPNKSDRILGDPEDLGGDIFIHGSCATIGCIPINDDPIEEVYLISLDSETKGGQTPEVHIFPCRMEKESCRKKLIDKSKENKDLQALWQDLERVYLFFEKERKLPSVDINEEGRYQIKFES